MKTNKKIGFLLILFFIFCITFSVKVKAATVSFDASPNSTVTVGTTVTIKVTGTAASWDLYIQGDGIEKKSIVELPNSSATNKSISESVSFTPTKAGTYNFTLTGTIIDENDELEGTRVNKTITITVKEKEQPTPTPTSEPTPTPTSTPTKAPTATPTKTGEDNKPEETPDFKNANGKVYTTDEVNLRDSWSTNSKATRIAKGTATKKVNNYVWYRVTYNGQTKYIASNYITTTKPEDDSKNNNLSSLKVSGVTLSPSFDKETCFYEAMVSDSVTSLDIKATAESENSTVKIEGNENLKEGENIVKITVTSKDGTSKIYTITVKKLEEEVITNSDENLKLSKLEILGVNFEDGFNPDLLSYELNLSLPVTSLTITATPNKENAKVEIIGNEGFVAGENLVTVIVTSADGKETVAYQIKVTVPEEASEPVVNEIMFYVICAIVIVVAIIIAVIVFIVSKAKNKNEKEDIDVVDNKKKNKGNKRLEYQRIEEIDDNQIDEEKENTLENDEIEEIEYKKEPARNRKGKHSN